ncbi:CPBP family glutamic-type intramembrane protease [Paracoccus jiaweipingae]|uniref:CPBP family glutamic-type intramembrane protease n=1 Tax=unclassified Paracoccus (in: a-proteobacteria) TaxID=2688777 RepID=UPI00378BA75C
MAGTASAKVTPRALLWAEFGALFIAAPLAIALFLPPRQMFGALFAFTLVGLFLIWRTGQFDWRGLGRGWARVDWRRAAGFAVAVGLVSWGGVQLTAPQAALGLWRDHPRLLLLIWLLYPLLSALPQELIFRALFFHRYATLMGGPRAALWVNAAVFSLAHLMYWNLLVAAMTFAGGFIFARAYVSRGFPSALVLHALAGNMLFTAGMGLYFYSGNVVRPF